MKKTIKPIKKTVKKEIKLGSAKPKLAKIKEIELKEEIKEVLTPKFIYGDFIIDTNTGKVFVFHNQHSVNANPNRFRLAGMR